MTQSRDEHAFIKQMGDIVRPGGQLEVWWFELRVDNATDPGNDADAVVAAGAVRGPAVVAAMRESFGFASWWTERLSYLQVQNRIQAEAEAVDDGYNAQVVAEAVARAQSD